MVSKIRSLGIQGIGGYEVSVECFLSNGLPAFDIVGLPDTAVKESRERVRAAVKNSGFSFPVSRLTVNLAPADTKKIGTVYDLPVFLGILAASGNLKSIPENAAFFGELSLSGELRPVRGALPMALAAERCGITELFVPVDNAAEAAFAQNVSVYPVENAAQLVRHLRGEEMIAAMCPPVIESCGVYPLDFADVKGQTAAKRSIEIAAAGGHNILLIGPPGSGKSMLAKRIPSILPDMSRDEMIETTEIHSVVGLTSKEQPLVTVRPFRAPHHTVSTTALSGGGSIPRPGEVSLAHNGVLFLDELPEFARDTMEVLRQPLEDGVVTVSRVAGSYCYPSRFMLVAAMNPCKCGQHGFGRCRCSENEVLRYRGRISGPLLDRIDIIMEVPALDFDELRNKPSGESSAEIKKRCDKAREIQRKRFSGSGTNCNAEMSPKEMQLHCGLSPDCQELLRGAFDTLNLTARSYDRILRVARTIADLEGAENIALQHIAEAVQYRSFSFDTDNN